MINPLLDWRKKMTGDTAYLMLVVGAMSSFCLGLLFTSLTDKASNARR